MAFYLYVLPLGSWASLAVIVVLAILTFVPSKYLYPSQPGRFNQAATILGILWTVPLGWLIWNLPASTTPRHDPSIQRGVASLVYPVLPRCFVGHQRGHWIKLTLEPPGRGRIAPSRCSDGFEAGRPRRPFIGPGLPLALVHVHHPEQEAANDKEADDAENRPSARSRQDVDDGEQQGPKMPANFSATPKKPKYSPDLSRGIRLAKSERLRAWVPPCTIPTRIARIRKSSSVRME